MTAEKREFFSNNTIQESLCQLTFKNVLDLNKTDEFEKRIKALGVYTISEKLPFINFNINLGDNGDNKPQKELLSGIKLSNINKDKVIQVFQNNLSIHQISNYKTWEDFRDDIFSVLKEFSAIYNIEIARIDMRAINKFDFITIENAKEYLNLNLAIPNSFNNTHSINFSVEQVLEVNKTFVAVRANHNRTQNNFILDLHFVDLIKDKLNTSDLDSIKVILEKGHINLYNTFTTTITPQTKAKIK